MFLFLFLTKYALSCKVHSSLCCVSMCIYNRICFLAGVDPKSILCEFFKAGQCQKGFKCKFSHDLNIQRKGEKIDIYSDKRDEGKSARVIYIYIYIYIYICIILVS